MCSGLARSLLEIGHGPRQGLAGGRIVAAVQPDFRARNSVLVQRPRPQPLQPRGPLGGRQTRGDMLAGEAEGTPAHGRRDRRPGVIDLMRTQQSRKRQVQQALLVLEHQTAMLFVGVPILARRQDRRPDAGRPPQDRVQDDARLGRDHAGNVPAS